MLCPQEKYSVFNFRMHKSLCTRLCDCVCHKFSRRRSLEVINKLFGALFIGYVVVQLAHVNKLNQANVPRYSGLPVLSPKCNSKNCRNQAAYSLEITYRFPQWLLAKAIYLVAAKTCTGDPVFGLTVQRRVDRTRQDTIIQFANLGNNEVIRIMLDKREASPNDIDFSFGGSALQVCGVITLL